MSREGYPDPRAPDYSTDPRPYVDFAFTAYNLANNLTYNVNGSRLVGSEARVFGAWATRALILGVCKRTSCFVSACLRLLPPHPVVVAAASCSGKGGVQAHVRA